MTVRLSRLQLALAVALSGSATPMVDEPVEPYFRLRLGNPNPLDMPRPKCRDRKRKKNRKLSRKARRRKYGR
ncbi:hypothetical protein [Bowmanella denitrificans]|uniref:hypothetical protein n=1 Tax=Bowmanella denitrificans TaxID=366582 RepID=UPI000C9B1BAF|nr:hypothetical protein [Bowmanella denitrificans]